MDNTITFHEEEIMSILSSIDWIIQEHEKQMKIAITENMPVSTIMQHHSTCMYYQKLLTELLADNTEVGIIGIINTSPNTIKCQIRTAMERMYNCPNLD